MPRRKTKMAQTMNLLMPGNAFLYYGEESGMRGTANDVDCSVLP